VTAANDASTAATGGAERSGLDLYFCSSSSGGGSGGSFKTTILYRPYFFVLLSDDDGINNKPITDIVLELVTSSLNRLLDGTLYHAEIVHKIDLEQTNHLSPSNRNGRPMLKLVFDNVTQLIDAREQIRAIIERNKKNRTQCTFSINELQDQQQGEGEIKDPLGLMTDMREYDVPYVVRVCTDLDIRAGTWYTVQLDGDDVDNDDSNGGVRLVDPDRESKASPTFLAFDIECTKAPLKFPSAEIDEIFMISYMVSTPGGGSHGYLIVSRSVVSQDVDDFEYTPKPTYPGPFTIFNEPNEKALLQRFFDEYRKHSPQIVVTYNGDFFDWPFVDARAKIHGMKLFEMTGVEQVGGEGGEYRGRSSVHLDAFHWVQRDSYLPQGSQGLKAVTKYKLGYDPVEVDPEDMVRYAQEQPIKMATYSVSDAVATYYLYEKYVHLFIFSLCTIIPLGPEDVLRKGSGTLCETLLMVQACSKDIICPNKQVDPMAKFHNGHLLESETYIGGKVECLETGVYRSDLEYDFDLKPSAFQELIDNIDRDLCFAIEVEGGLDRKDISNYDEVRVLLSPIPATWHVFSTGYYLLCCDSPTYITFYYVILQIRSEIIEALEMLRDKPKRKENPYVYHLDVGAMYPNIILSNRLQPTAIVDDSTCASCDFNQAKNNCKKRMEWIWRGDYTPASRSEYERAKDQLSREVVRDGLSFHQLPEREQEALVSSRLKNYSRLAYKKTKITEEQTREDVVCMRENPFYVDTVRDFRDRRYEFKKLNKSWKKKVANAKDAATKKQCEDKVLVYDSLQVAHKCILNSFYGYVMRKGARWRSMEMAGIVTRNGAQIIMQARELVEQIGRPLELDTDGIWCILPGSFPDVYNFETADGSKLKLEYPCVMLNAACHDKFTNHQYQKLIDPEKGIYSTQSECSIFFEVDGPYRCMFLPASTEEGKLLKKRYAVFNDDKSLAELKGFELKRRGELELIKTFQSEVFKRFLEGNSLEECYQAAADIANHWIDVIDTRAESLDDDELVDLISENRSMSRQLDDYGDQKGTSQTTARRLAEFLGSEITKDKGLNCKFIIAEQPYGTPVTDRAIPTAIWKADEAVMKHHLRKWLKAPGLDGDDLDMRNILDWDYYLDRLGKTIQKIITIPAALQKVKNPVPRVPHPEWLEAKVNQLNDRFKQKTVDSMFAALASTKKRETKSSAMTDIEDFGKTAAKVEKRPVVHSRRRQSPSVVSADEQPKPQNEERIVLSKTNVSSWIQQRKSTWRRLRKERREFSRSGPGDGNEKRPRRAATTIEGFVREAALSFSQQDWHIIEVRGSSAYDANQGSESSSGNFMVWVMSGSGSLQRVNVSVPRVLYISTRKEIMNEFDGVIDFRKVDKHLPHSKAASHVYELSMPEHIFRAQTLTKGLRPVDGSGSAGDVLETMYESETPLLSKILSSLGGVARLKGDGKNLKKSYDLSELTRVDRPAEGEYLHSSLSYRRIFMYVRIDPSAKVGIVALYVVEGGSGEGYDITRPRQGETSSFDVGASCHIWVVRPGSRNGQRNVSLKQCRDQFSGLLATIGEAASLETEYSCVSPESDISVASLNFVDTQDLAFAGANDVINSMSSHGPTFIMLNCNRPVMQLRRHMSTFSSFPVVSMPFPPGEAHNPYLSTLPPIGWEPSAVQLCLEAYLFAVVISFPKRVSYARYGRIPLGNLGDDENFAVYDVSLTRLLQKNRALSWASFTPGHPDLGVNLLPGSGGAVFPSVDESSYLYSQDEIWGDDDDLISPVIRRPGCYRNICVDIDVQDLAIAALTDVSAAMSSAAPMATGGGQGLADQNSPNSVTMLDGNFSMTKVSGPLGDEMSTSISLPIVRAIVSGWLRDAFASNSLVADELLHHIYRLLSCPESLFYDPALHRVVHSLMKTTFLRLLGELQRLGCSIVYATFHRITIATNKTHLSQAEEYMGFVLQTVRKRAADTSGHGDALARVSLRPRQFHTHLAFLDEFNYGTLHLARITKEEAEETEQDFVLPDENDPDSVVVAEVVTAWSILNYLGSEKAQQYFRICAGRFSKEIFHKQMKLELADDDEMAGVLVGANDKSQKLLDFKKMKISKHFASYLTRAVDEIAKDGTDDEILPPLLGDARKPVNPALEFIKNISVVLELDTEVEAEVQALKRSLLAQVGVAEYSRVAQWKNPCPRFILPDVFCTECFESRDVNLCYVPPIQADEEDYEKAWVCDDCGTPYDVNAIEHRLTSLLHRKVARYQLQDVRCVSTNRVATRALSPLADCASGLKLDITPAEATSEVRLLHSLAEFHDLGSLMSTTEGLLDSFR